MHSPGNLILFYLDNDLCTDSPHSSIDKVPKVTSPVLVIHGTEDEVIDFSHGVTIYEKCPRAVEPLWVEVNENNSKVESIPFKFQFFFFAGCRSQ